MLPYRTWQNIRGSHFVPEKVTAPRQPAPVRDEAAKSDLSNADQHAFLVAFKDLLIKHNAEGL